MFSHAVIMQVRQEASTAVCLHTASSDLAYTRTDTSLCVRWVLMLVNGFCCVFCHNRIDHKRRKSCTLLSGRTVLSIKVNAPPTKTRETNFPVSGRQGELSLVKKEEMQSNPSAGREVSTSTSGRKMLYFLVDVTKGGLLPHEKYQIFQEDQSFLQEAVKKYPIPLHWSYEVWENGEGI